MIKKLSKHGNSLALLIDKPILELLDVNENTEFKIRIDEGNIILEPVRKEEVFTISKDKKLQEAYEEIIKKYDSVLKKLAKS